MDEDQVELTGLAVQFLSKCILNILILNIKYIEKPKNSSKKSLNNDCSKMVQPGTFTGRENYLKYSWFYIIKSAVLGLVFTSRKRPWVQQIFLPLLVYLEAKYFKFM